MIAHKISQAYVKISKMRLKDYSQLQNNDMLKNKPLCKKKEKSSLSFYYSESDLTSPVKMKFNITLDQDSGCHQTCLVIPIIKSSKTEREWC